LAVQNNVDSGAEDLITERVKLDGRSLTASDIERIAFGARVELAEDRLEAVDRNRRALEDAEARGQAIYGLTTGLGALVERDVDPEEAAETQRAFLRSHAAGVGDPLPREVVRAALGVRLNCLLVARSGIHADVLCAAAELLNRDLVPWVPRTGSLGASGDLAPSAHSFLTLIGEGEFLTVEGARRPALQVLGEEGLAPIRLASREAIALINGTHFMSGIGALARGRAERLLDIADLISALTLEALRGFSAPFDPRVHELRAIPGQARTAQLVRAAIEGSTRIDSRRDAVQDAYTLRCVPQVHGAAREGVDFFARLIAADFNAAIDNPIVFDDPVEVVSAGNFHGQSLGLGFDTLRIALTDLASISERRTFRLLAPSLNGELPAFLTSHAGHASGYMVAQYTAAALLAEMRVLAHPVSIDNVPTSDNQEDHVSMGMTAALLALETLDRAEQVVAIEALCAAQALEWGEGQLGAGTARLQAAIRNAVPKLDDDRPPAYDIAAVRDLLVSGGLTNAAAPILADV
jgi:histidine ammonia-lyase